MSEAAVAEARAALEATGKLPDAEIDIGMTALHLARIDAPDADRQAARSILTGLARQAVERALGNRRADAGDAEARRRELAALLHEGFGLDGDRDSYEDMANANLIRVLERRRGLPVALGILWLHAAGAAGWEAHGVDFPGHFLLALRAADSPVLVDVFDRGAALDAPALRALVKRVEGASAELRPGMLVPMSRRAVLLRLQNNIKLRRLRVGDVLGALACTEDMLRISPDQPVLWREAGLMNQRLDRIGAAVTALERAVALAPQDPGAGRLRGLIEELRNRLN
jgi:regulator of sirC expression with transglutaminase-like and TPR domain